MVYWNNLSASVVQYIKVSSAILCWLHMESHFVVTAPTELKEGSFFSFFFINRPSRGVFRDLGSKWRRKVLCNVLIFKKISVNKLTVFRDLTMEGKKHRMKSTLTIRCIAVLHILAKVTMSSFHLEFCCFEINFIISEVFF